MILVKLKIHTKPKERIAQVTQERANQLIKAYPDVYSLAEEKPKEVKAKESKEKDETK